MLFIRHPFNSDLKCLDFKSPAVDGSVVRNAIVSHFGYGDFTLMYNGRKIQDAEIIPDNSTVHVTFSLPGGKGGFGSMLRAIGAQIEKTTNREACRDLSGRRLRDINEEQRLKKWISKEAEREAEKVRRRKARIERLKSKPAHKFFDYDYEKEISELPERINDALNEGLQKAKVPTEEAGSSKPPKKKWLSDEFSSASSDSDSEANVPESERAFKRPKIDPCDSDMSDLSQPGSSSRSNSHLESEENSNFNSDTPLGSDMKVAPEQSKGSTSNDSVEILSEDSGDNCNKHDSRMLVAEVKKDEVEYSRNEAIQSIPDVIKLNEPETRSNAESKTEDTLPINLLEFETAHSLECLGLDKLKSELMARGLKCGGTLPDRANRLWKVRGLQPCEYPADLLAKSKRVCNTTSL